MSKKKSLGHNPLTNKSKDKATLDFIKDKLKDDVKSFEHQDSKVEFICKLDKEIVATFYKIADERGLTISDIVNDCLKKYIQENH